MFQPYTPLPRPHSPPPWLLEAALWLAHLGLFAGLLWLSPLSRKHPPSEAEKAHTEDQALCHTKFGPEPARVKLVAPPKPKDFGCPGPTTSDVLGYDEGPWSNAIPYSMAGMTPPKLISGKPPRYTPEALAARVQGLIIAKCTITCRGHVQDCHIFKSLPHMDEAVLSELESRRYTPVTYQGRVVSVSYLFNVKLSLP